MKTFLKEALSNVKVSHSKLEEDINKVEYLTEDQKTLWRNYGNTPLYVKGSAGYYSEDYINKNRRRYLKSRMKEWIKGIQEDVSNGKVTGRLDHAKAGENNLDGTAFKFVKLEFDENSGQFLYEGHTLPTAKGTELKNLIVSEVFVGNSTNGRGDIERITINDEVVEDVISYNLEGIDFVKNPSNEYGKVHTYEDENEASFIITYLL